VLDGNDLDAMPLWVDSVDDAIVTSPCAVQPFELEPKREPV